MGHWVVPWFIVLCVRSHARVRLALIWGRVLAPLIAIYSPSNLMLWLTLAVTTSAPHVIYADELINEYFYANVSYPTLSAAETAMRSAGGAYWHMKQYKQEYDTTNKQITFKYKVYDIPAYQVGPIGYTTPSHCSEPRCYSEQAAYDAMIASTLEWSQFCKATIVPTSDWYMNGSIGFGYTPGYTQGLTWPDGKANTYKTEAKTFDLNRFWVQADGSCAEYPETFGYEVKSWMPWGCPAEYKNVTVNSPFDTCQITTEATITAKPLQFPSCNAQTAPPIALLTGDKLLRQQDIALGDLRLSRCLRRSGAHTTRHGSWLAIQLQPVPDVGWFIINTTCRGPGRWEFREAAVCIQRLSKQWRAESEG